MKEMKRNTEKKAGEIKPHLAVTLSTAVTEVGVALCAGHVIAALCSLNVDLEGTETSRERTVSRQTGQ